ncbi:uncharacterized protein LOC123552426 isoform X3 [Mercenaria mercenaria]|uniref:uncharacterized protein LOC123552426 isoform X3 n=1 Tax=Mercenaria mercenaria TaxID=6596 RepID=UPI00234EB9B6|nr:uncharacterized protein LOC123552426 isoform X3 [Mercenaria mercenaria]
MASKARKLRPPPDSYQLNNFVTELSKEITRQDLDELKRRFRDIISDNVQSAKEMFDELREKEYVNCHNILYIQQIIRVLNRTNLLEIAAKYIKQFEEDDILHFFEKKTEPAPGCAIVEFHVVGHRISNKKALEQFRLEVSRILMIPRDDVIIKGVQATSSILITLMLPDMYVNYLKSQIEKNKQYMISSLIQQGVDEVRFTTVDFTLQKEGRYFISKKGQVSEETGHQKTTTKMAERREQTSGSLQTNSKSLHAKILKRDQPEKSVVTRSNAQSLSPVSKKMRIHVDAVGPRLAW